MASAPPGTSRQSRVGVLICNNPFWPEARKKRPYSCSKTHKTVHSKGGEEPQPQRSVCQQAADVIGREKVWNALDVHGCLHWVQKSRRTDVRTVGPPASNKLHFPQGHCCAKPAELVSIDEINVSVLTSPSLVCTLSAAAHFLPSTSMHAPSLRRIH